MSDYKERNGIVVGRRDMDRYCTAYPIRQSSSSPSTSYDCNDELDEMLDQLRMETQKQMAIIE